MIVGDVHIQYVDRKNHRRNGFDGWGYLVTQDTAVDHETGEIFFTARWFGSWAKTVAYIIALGMTKQKAEAMRPANSIRATRVRPGR